MHNTGVHPPVSNSLAWQASLSWLWCSCGSSSGCRTVGGPVHTCRFQRAASAGQQGQSWTNRMGVLPSNSRGATSQSGLLPTCRQCTTAALPSGTLLHSRLRSMAQACRGREWWCGSGASTVAHRWCAYRGPAGGRQGGSKEQTATPCIAPPKRPASARGWLSCTSRSAAQRAQQHSNSSQCTNRPSSPPQPEGG